MTKVVIVGSGAAGFFAAQQIRKNDAEAEITILSAESVAPYYRINLTEAIRTGESVADLQIKKPEYYEDNKIDLRLSVQVASVDYEKQEVVLSDSSRVPYDKLLLATGSNPFIPPYEGGKLDGIFSIRTVEDLEALRSYFPKMHRVFVIGGGLLGLEAAYALRSHDFEVHVCEFAEQLLIRQLDEETGNLVQERLEKEEGLHIHVGASLKAVHGDGKVTSVTLTNGQEMDCDAVVFSVGIRSNTELAGGALEVNRGIVVDEGMHTADPNVWAAGDVAELNGRTMGLWTASMEMGKVAGNTMTGKEAAYDAPLLFTSLQIGGVKLFSAGSHDGAMVKKEGEDGAFAKFFYDADDKLVGTILYKNTALMGKAKTWIRERAAKADIEKALQD